MEPRPWPARQATFHDVSVIFSPIRMLLMGSLLWILVCLAPGQSDSQTPSAPVTTTDSTAAQNSELASHDEPIAFKANANLVVVRTVVRDQHGMAVGNLHKEDFQVFDKGKPQVITQFEVEGAGTSAKADQTAKPASGQDTPAGKVVNGENTPAIPGRFVAYLFDDVHLGFGDLAHVRDAATRHLGTLRPADRAAVFTTSGLVVLDFTNDRAKLNEALLRVRPQQNNLLRNFENTCPQITFYEADLIINKDDAEAEQIAVNEAGQCSEGNTVPTPGAELAQGRRTVGLVRSLAQNVLSVGEQESLLSINMLREVVRSVSRMPGERSIVVLSPGFLILWFAFLWAVKLPMKILILFALRYRT